MPQKFSIRLSALIIMLMISASSCCTLLQQLQGSYVSLWGAWQSTDSQKPWILTFHKDNTYTIDGQADGTVEIGGTYVVSRNLLLLKDLRGDFIKECGQEGAYYYDVKGREIHFDLIADSCKAREDALNLSWQRKKAQYSSTCHFHGSCGIKGSASPNGYCGLSNEGSSPKINWTWRKP